jgi:hypothetical protein
LILQGVLKLYFRELPESLLNEDLYVEWLMAVKITDHNNKYASSAAEPLPPHVRTWMARGGNGHCCVASAGCML